MFSVARLQQQIMQDRRLQRVLHGSISGLVSKLATLLVSAITLPLLVHYLGALEYGIWVTISTSIAMLVVLDLGIANTLTNLIAEAHAEGDRQKAQRYFATAFWVTLLLVLLLTPVLLLAWRTVPWGSVFHVSDPELVRESAQCIAIAGGFFLLSLPLTLANRVLGGFQQVHLANYFSIANNVCGLFATVVTVSLHGSLVALMAAYGGGMLVGTLALNLWLCFWQRPWIRPMPNKMTAVVIRRLFGQSILFFVIQITGLVVFSSDNLVITHYLGADAVTPYSVAWKLSQYASLLQAVLMPSLWPAISEAYHRRDMVWVRRTYRGTRQRVLTAVGIASMVVGLFGRSIIRVWTAGAVVPGGALIWLMAIFAFVMACTNQQALLLAAVERLKLEATVAVLAAAANLCGSILLIQRIGVNGVILSTLASFLLFMILPQAWEVRRVLQGRFLKQGAGTVESAAS